MTLGAVVLGFFLPYLDLRLGANWMQAVGFIRATEVDGARAILTTLAGATLGVAGVAFSVTIVAVSFASSNYGPRLIGNFMGDRKNQIVPGIFVATFVYCITVLSTVHSSSERSDSTLEAFVPQLSILFALLLTLAAVGALIAYIHHVPESINIMNLTAKIGEKLHCSIISMLDLETARSKEQHETPEVQARGLDPQVAQREVICAEVAGYLQQVDMESLAALAQEKQIVILLHRAPGDFLVAGEQIMSAVVVKTADESIAHRMRKSYTLGSSRTDVQDVLFLSDQLVEVLGRALSPGVNDPHTAMLCLNWLRSGLVAFAERPPSHLSTSGYPVRYQVVTFEEMLNRSFDRMRQYIAADRTVTLHALAVLADIALAASRQVMADACVKQICALSTSAHELLTESVAHDEIENERNRVLVSITSRVLQENMS